MGKMEFRLNPKKPGNYAFFCPVTRLHLTLANPVGYTDRISNYILRAIKGGTLIDVNKAVNLETGEKVENNEVTTTQQVEKEQEKPVETVTPSQPELEQTQEPEKESSQEAEVAVEDDKKSNKRGRKPQN